MPRSPAFLATGTGVAALVFSVLSAVYLAVGGVLAAIARGGGMRAGGGALGWGALFLAAGLLLAVRRAAVVRRRARLLSSGVACSGRISDVRQRRWVRVNRRHPWVVSYRYEAAGAEHEAREVLWDLPAGFAVGAQVGVLHDASCPGESVLRGT